MEDQVMSNVVIMVVRHRGQSRPMASLSGSSRAGSLEEGGMEGQALELAAGLHPKPPPQNRGDATSTTLLPCELPNARMGEMPQECCPRKAHQMRHSLLAALEGT